MKITLAFLVCSFIAGECAPPIVYPIKFDDAYDCMTFGYSESLKRIEEIGREEINKRRVYVKFGCYIDKPEQKEEST